MKKICHVIRVLWVGFILLFTACNSTSAGITIPQSDSTAPTLTLGAGQEGGGNDVTVTPGGSNQTMTLLKKTGSINLAATARDPESGVQAVEIWMSKLKSTCGADGVCALEGPSNAVKIFESVVPQKMPGETTSESSILLQPLDLSKEIPASYPAGGSLAVELRLYAVAVNHLGGRTQTAELKVVWQEP